MAEADSSKAPAQQAENLPLLENTMKESLQCKQGSPDI